MSHEIISKIAASGGGVVLVTVVNAKGSVPRHLGSKMLVRADGSILGTVGGGKVEAQAIEAAKDCIAGRRSSSLHVELTGSETMGADLICGGIVDLAIDFIDSVAAYTAAAEILDRGEKVLLVREEGHGESQAGCIAVLDARGGLVHGATRTFDAEAVAAALESEKPVASDKDQLLYDPLAPSEQLLILGAGHVGLALGRLGSELDFRVSVGDPRPEYADPHRFPPGVQTLRSGFVEIVENYPFGPLTSVVIVSPSHLSDIECVRAVLKRKYRYAGFIGSRRKVRMVLEQLKSEGFDPQKVDALHAPIGLDIGAETPAEIAVSILAEIIALRRRSPAMASMAEDRARRRQ